MTTAALPHRWQFFRAGGADQVGLKRGATFVPADAVVPVPDSAS